MAHASLDLGIGHAEQLAPLVAQTLHQAGARPADISHVIATVGPGSFMGVRVGMSFAKGFAFAHQATTLPITTLAALWLTGEPAPGADGYVLIDARRGQVYGQGFGPSASAPFLLDLAAAKARVHSTIAAPKTTTFMGSGVPLVVDDQDAIDDAAARPTVPDMGKVAAAAPTLTPGALAPLYLRAPDAARAK